MGSIHGAWCNARTIPMTCKYCNQEVFYFFCDCGCKVFFDALGEPWPKHYCADYEKAIFPSPVYPQEDIQEDATEGKMFTWTLLGPDEKIDIDIELSYSQTVRENKIRINEKRYTIEKIEPSVNAYLNQTGIVRELIGPINKEKKFRIRIDSAFGYQLLGAFREEDFMQITMHTTNLAFGTPRSFTFLIPSKMTRKRIKIGSHIFVTLVSESVKGKNYWYCRSIESFE